MDDREVKAVDQLDEKLITPSVLALPHLNGYYTINTDSCYSNVGYVLLQEQRGNELKSVGYWSRSLCEMETRYDITHNKCLPVGCGTTTSISKGITLYNKDVP